MFRSECIMSTHLGNKFRFRSWESHPPKKSDRKILLQNVLHLFRDKFRITEIGLEEIGFDDPFWQWTPTTKTLLSFVFLLFFRAILLPRAVRAWWQFEGVPKSQPEESDGMFVVVSFSSVIVFAFVDELPRLNWVISCFTLKKQIPDFCEIIEVRFSTVLKEDNIWNLANSADVLKRLVFYFNWVWIRINIRFLKWNIV